MRIFSTFFNGQMFLRLRGCNFARTRGTYYWEIWKIKEDKKAQHQKRFEPTASWSHGMRSTTARLKDMVRFFLTRSPGFEPEPKTQLTIKWKDQKTHFLWVIFTSIKTCFAAKIVKRKGSKLNETFKETFYKKIFSFHYFVSLLEDFFFIFSECFKRGQHKKT